MCPCGSYPVVSRPPIRVRIVVKLIFVSDRTDGQPRQAQQAWDSGDGTRTKEEGGQGAHVIDCRQSQYIIAIIIIMLLSVESTLVVRRYFLHRASATRIDGSFLVSPQKCCGRLDASSVVGAPEAVLDVAMSTTSVNVVVEHALAVGQG